MVAAAIIGSAAISATASVAASGSQSHAANQAAALQTPYSQAGTAALNPLQGLLGINGADMQSYLKNIPGYQFTLGQGLESTQNGFAARGLGSSGAALKGAANYATGLAQNTYQNSVGNLQNFANMGSNAAAGVGSNLIQAGNAQAAGFLGAGNAIGNAGLTYGLLNNAGSAGAGGSSTGSLLNTTFGTSGLNPTVTQTPVF